CCFLALTDEFHEDRAARAGNRRGYPGAGLMQDPERFKLGMNPHICLHETPLARFVGQRALVAAEKLPIAPRLIVGVIAKSAVLARSISLGRNVLVPRPPRAPAAIHVRFLALANDSQHLGYQSIGEKRFERRLNLDTAVARLSQSSKFGSRHSALIGYVFDCLSVRLSCRTAMSSPPVSGLI